jgi:glutamate formiminotransferase
VIDALATHDATKRQHIALRYKELYEKDLAELMKSEFKGDFGLALKFMALPLNLAEAAMIRKATSGIGASVKIVWSIMCGRTNEEMELLKKTYFKKYEKDLGKLLGGELHGDMERLIFNCMQAAEEVYDPQFHTAEKATEDAEIIHAKGQGRRFGTDERGIFKVLCSAPKEHLENISKVYAEKYGYTLWKAMEKEMTGEVQNATVHMVTMKTKPYEALAKLIKDACAGFGTDELLLTCSIIRTQGVLQQVQSAHIEMYGKTIHERVRKEAGGKYKELLLQMLNAAWPEQG